VTDFVPPKFEVPEDPEILAVEEAAAQIGTAIANGEEWPEAVSLAVKRWEVDSISRAEHAMRRLRLAYEAANGLTANYTQFIYDLDVAYEQARAPIDEWYKSSLLPLNNTIAFFTGHLERFALERRRELEEAGDRKAPKGLALPSGAVKVTAGRRGFNITDEQHLLECLDMHLPAAVLASDVIKRSVRISELVKVPGVEVHSRVEFRVGDSDTFEEVYDTEIAEGDEWPDADTGELVKVTEVWSPELVLCYRYPEDPDRLVELAGVEVVDGATTSKVVVR